MAKRPIQPDDLLRYVFVGDPQISPDGARVLFQRKVIDRNKYVTNLFTVDFDGHLRQITQGDGGESNGRWSPDGSQIAFIGKRGESSQIFLLPTDGGEAAALTNLPEGSLGGFRWSPDGTKLAFTFRPSMPTETAAAKKEREANNGSLPPIEIDDIWYRLDGDGYFAGQRYAVYVTDLTTRETRKLYEAAPNGNYSFDWSPASDELIVAHTANAHPFRETPNDQLYRVKLDGTATMLAGLPKGEKTSPRWSPNGELIAYAGDVDEKDPWGTRNTKIYLVSPNGGEPRDLTGHLDFDMDVATLSDTAEAAFGAKLEWAADSSGVYVQVGTKGETQLGFVGTNGGVTLLTEGRHAVVMGGVHADGRVAATVSTPTKLPEVAVVERELGTGRHVPRLLTGLNLAFHEEVEVLEPQEFWVDSTDGTKVHTWAIVPKSGKLATLLNIHGGPHTQYGWTYFHEFQVFAAQGYAVVYSNPRGSKGYGEAHCAAIAGDWGNKDWDDIQAVTAWMKVQPWCDADKLGVMGGSYGGYMTNWVIGHTHEFACAITDRCVSNMVSMAGNSDFPFNKDGYFKGVAWGSLEKIKELWRQSPIAYFESVQTPTLVVHSEGDLRCNVEQGEQVFTALQQQGVPSRFVRYPSTTSHGLSRSGPPDLRLHRLGEYLGWIKRWLG